MRKISCVLNLKPILALYMMLGSMIVLCLSQNTMQSLLAYTVLALSLSYLTVHILLGEITDSQKLFSELESALKRGTTADPDNESPATDVEIEIIMNQLEDAECSDESQTKEFLYKAHELIKAYRPWYSARYSK